MPTYEYECQTCHERVEAVQKFTDPSLTTCPRCGGELRKVFSAVGIVFKGSGFYKNDSRGAKSSPTTSEGSNDAPATVAPPAESTPSTPTAPAATKTETKTETTASATSD
jgi:putative FmdB family regulatory protein